MSAIIWDEESRSFSVVEDQREFATKIDPKTGEIWQQRSDGSWHVVTGEASKFGKKSSSGSGNTTGKPVNTPKIDAKKAKAGYRANKKDTAKYRKYYDKGGHFDTDKALKDGVITKEAYDTHKQYVQNAKDNMMTRKALKDTQAQLTDMTAKRDALGKSLTDTRGRLVKMGRQNRNLKIGLGVAGGAAAVGAGAYLYQRHKAKKAQRELEERRRLR